MIRTAILFSGSAYNVRFSLDSLMENLIVPNDADVFVVTTRICKRRKTPASTPIPDPNVDWESYRKKNERTVVDDTPLSDEELQLIRDKFGDRLKVLVVAEEMPDYWNSVISGRIQMKDTVNNFILNATSKSQIPAFGGMTIDDHNSGTIRYTSDQYRHVKKCYELMEDYENLHGFKYNHIMRARIDFIAPEVINLNHYMQNHDGSYLYVMGSFRRDKFPWSDEFSWFSNRKIASRLYPSLDRMGLITDRKYNTINVGEGNDMRFGPEVQFDLLLQELGLPCVNVKIYRSAQYSPGDDGWDYFNYRFSRGKIEIEYEYELVCRDKSDINEHLPTLRSYASQCDHVTEIGVRYGNSTVGLMAANPKYFVSYDVCHEDRMDYLKMIAVDNGINWELKLINPTDTDNNVSLIEETDLLFIDTNHNVDCLEPELRLHSPKVRRFIIMHDTQTYWHQGTGYDHGGGGMKLALEPFLAAHPEWIIKERFTNNNGLTILQRIWKFTTV